MVKIPRSPLHLVDYAFRALGKNQLPLQQLIFFLSFDIRQMPPSKAQTLIRDLESKGQIAISNDTVTISSEITPEHEALVSKPMANLGEMLRLFVSSSRLSRAVGMSDNAIEFNRINQNPLQIKATVHGSQDYTLRLDEAAKRIEHDCPDWRRVSMLHRFCKHVAKLFLLLEKDEALRLLYSIQQESWDFESL